MLAMVNEKETSDSETQKKLTQSRRVCTRHAISEAHPSNVINDFVTLASKPSSLFNSSPKYYVDTDTLIN